MIGVAFGHSPQCVQDSFPRRRTGFSLVELFVVIGIIVLLAALLLPALSLVREQATRIKCSANLRTLGAASFKFAADHNGYFPGCYRMRDTTTPAAASYPYYIPFCISQGSIKAGQKDTNSNDTDQTWWSVFGTTWTEWQRYGVNLQTLSCPSSSGGGAVLADYSSSNLAWGAVVWMDYMYVGSLSTSLLHYNPILYQNASGAEVAGVQYTQYSVDHWGTMVPAVTANTGAQQIGGRTVTGAGDPVMITVQSRTFILAADMVFYSGGAGCSWDSVSSVASDKSSRYRINHPQRNNPLLPDFQNILYSDGSVSPHNKDDYTQPLNTDSATSQTANWSMMLSSSTTPGDSTSGTAASGVGGFLYWGENEALPLPIPDVIPPATQPGGSTWGVAQTFKGQATLTKLPTAPPVVASGLPPIYVGQ